MKSKNKLDERQNKVRGKAMAISAVLIFIYQIAIAIYIFIKSGNIKLAYMEIILIIAMLVSVFGYFVLTGHYDKSIEKGNKSINLSKIDERTKIRIVGALAMSGYVAILVLINIIILKFVTTKSFESTYLQIAPLLIMTVTNAVYTIKNKEFNVPTTFFGKKLPLGDSKEDKRSRLIYYAKDGIRFSIVLLILDIINPDRLIFSIPSLNWKYIPYIIHFLSRFAIFIIMNYAWGEYNIRKQRKFNKSLDDE